MKNLLAIIVVVVVLAVIGYFMVGLYFQVKNQAMTEPSRHVWSGVEFDETLALGDSIGGFTVESVNGLMSREKLMAEERNFDVYFKGEVTLRGTYFSGERGDGVPVLMLDEASQAKLPRGAGEGMSPKVGFANPVMLGSQLRDGQKIEVVTTSYDYAGGFYPRPAKVQIKSIK